MAEQREARLVLYRDEAGARAALYASEATRYSTPIVTFALAPDQRLPSVGPGALVTVEGELSTGSRSPVHVGDVLLVPATPFRAGDASGRMFAERGDIIGDPRAIGWNESWETVSSSSLDDLDAWERRLGRARRAGITGVVLLVVVVAVVVLGSLDGDPPVVVAAWGAVGGFGTAIAGWRHARRAHRALDAARGHDLEGEPRSMAIGLWWAAGSTLGPQAVAALSSAGDGAPAAEVPIINVPVGYDPPPGHVVEVFGDPLAAPIIRDGTTLLWPAEHALTGRTPAPPAWPGASQAASTGTVRGAQ